MATEGYMKFMWLKHHHHSDVHRPFSYSTKEPGSSDIVEKVH